MEIERRIEPLDLAVTATACQWHEIWRWGAVGIRTAIGGTIENAARWMSFANEHRTAKEIECASLRKRRPADPGHVGQVNLSHECERNRFRRLVRPDLCRRPLKL